jgi:hypothetical protein
MGKCAIFAMISMNESLPLFFRPENKNGIDQIVWAKSDRDSMKSATLFEGISARFTADSASSPDVVGNPMNGTMFDERNTGNNNGIGPG